MNDSQINAAMAELDGWKLIPSYDDPMETVWMEPGGYMRRPEPPNYLDPERTHAERVMMEWCKANKARYEIYDNAVIVRVGYIGHLAEHTSTPKSITLAVCEATLRAAGKWEGVSDGEQPTH